MHGLFHSLGKQHPGSQAPVKPMLKKGPLFRLSIRLGPGPTRQVDMASECPPERVDVPFSGRGRRGVARKARL